MNEEKKCTRCQQEFGLDNFYKLTKTRIDSWCKGCRKSVKKAKYKSKPYTQNYNGFVKLLDWYVDVKLSELSELEKALERMVEDAKKTCSGIQPSKLSRAKGRLQPRSSGRQEQRIRGLVT